MKRTIILASNSPRRKELLSSLGIPYVVDPADVDEQVRSGETPETYAVRVADDKARVTGQRSGGGIIIAADTIVVVDNAILGKPVSPEDAARMLTMLSGRMHQVMTGLAVLDAATEKCATRLSVTKVWFRKLSSKEIAAYIATKEPFDKAGAYGIQEKGALLVDRIEGCYFNVVGLPLSLLGEMLRDFGISLL